LTRPLLAARYFYSLHSYSPPLDLSFHSLSSVNASTVAIVKNRYATEMAGVRRDPQDERRDPYLADKEITQAFDTEPKDIAERIKWLKSHDDRHPVLVSLSENKIMGWSALSRWSKDAPTMIPRRHRFM
jgi:hypothetical protein